MVPDAAASHGVVSEAGLGGEMVASELRTRAMHYAKTGSVGPAPNGVGHAPRGGHKSLVEVIDGEGLGIQSVAHQLWPRSGRPFGGLGLRMIPGASTSGLLTSCYALATPALKASGPQMRPCPKSLRWDAAALRHPW